MKLPFGSVLVSELVHILKTQPKHEMSLLYQTEIHRPLNTAYLLSADVFLFKRFLSFISLNVDYLGIWPCPSASGKWFKDHHSIIGCCFLLWCKMLYGWSDEFLFEVAVCSILLYFRGRISHTSQERWSIARGFLATGSEPRVSLTERTGLLLAVRIPWEMTKISIWWSLAAKMDTEAGGRSGGLCCHDTTEECERGEGHMVLFVQSPRGVLCNYSGNVLCNYLVVTSRKVV